MGLEQAQSIDAIGCEVATGEIVLTIFDSWEWRPNELEHLHALQEKMNAYFTFVESEQIFEVYPAAKGRKIRINVITRFPLSKAGIALLRKADEVASELEIRVSYELFEG